MWYELNIALISLALFWVVTGLVISFAGPLARKASKEIEQQKGSRSFSALVVGERPPVWRLRIFELALRAGIVVFWPFFLLEGLREKRQERALEVQDLTEPPSSPLKVLLDERCGRYPLPGLRTH